MMSVALKSAAALFAAAGLAATSVDDFTGAPAYGDGHVKALTEDAVAAHASTIFHRADRDQNGFLDADEYASLSIVAAELARLNGFVVIESDDGPATLTLASTGPAALSRAEHIRIDAVARSAFYTSAGEDGRMSESEYLSAQRASFDAADFNANGVLRRGELEAFAQRQALATMGV